MRRSALIALCLAGLAGGLAAVAGADGARMYKVEMYNAFGVVEGSDVRVAGVNVGSVTDLTVNADKRALVTVEVEGELAELGDATKCSTAPQSLIAEYFIDCEPAGTPLPEGGTIPASQVSQTVQPDLVQNTLREPYKLRLQLLINEFGTALGGNSDDLNEAIRLGAPALTELNEVTGILASQAQMIRDLNVDSDRVIGELARYRQQIREFVDEAEDAGAASAERREDLSRDFDLFDDFLAEFEPTLVELERSSREQTPLLENLRAAAPELNRLALALPAFNRVTARSLTSLGDAARVGERALRRGRDEIELLAKAGLKAPVTAEILADLLRDLDDPRRAVEINDLVAGAAGRTSTRPGTRNTMGYTGLEGLLDYAYYQPLALNQFDEVGHMLHFGLYEVFSGPCAEFDSGRNTTTGEPGVPAAGGGTTTRIQDLAKCGGWLGPNQPGINQDLGLDKYDPSVCPDDTAPEQARIDLCDPDDAAAAAQGSKRQAGQARAGGNAGRDNGGGAPADPQGALPELPGTPDEIRETLEDLLDLPGNTLDDLGIKGLGKGGKGGKPGGGNGAANVNQAAQDLLDFLFAP